MYWLVSLPHGGRPDAVWSQLQELTTYANDYSHNFRFALPDSFRVGTLDSLMGLSDDLAKVNAAVEGTVNKVRRQLVELQSSLAPEDRADVWVEGQTPEGYLQRFAWNEAKYPSRRPLKDIVASIMDTVQKLDDDLKVGLGCAGARVRLWVGSRALFVAVLVVCSFVCLRLWLGGRAGSGGTWDRGGIGWRRASPPAGGCSVWPPTHAPHQL